MQTSIQTRKYKKALKVQAVVDWVLAGESISRFPNPFSVYEINDGAKYQTMARLPDGARLPVTVEANDERHASYVILRKIARDFADTTYQEAADLVKMRCDELNRSESTVVQYKSSITKLAGYFPDKRLHELTEQDAQDFVRKGMVDNHGKRLEPITIAKHGRQLKAIAKQLCLEGLLKENIWHAVEYPKVRPLHKRAPSTSEIEQLLLSLDGTDEIQLRLQAILIMLCTTGMRIGELLHAEEGWLSSCGQFILIQNTKSFNVKDYEKRSLRLNESAQRALDVLLSLKRSFTPWLLEEGEEHLSDQTLREQLLDHVGNCWLFDKKFHALRRYYATQLYYAEADILGIRKVMGHSSLETTLSYIDIYESEYTVAQALNSNAFNFAIGHNITFERMPIEAT